jgi:hypothetical protein
MIYTENFIAGINARVNNQVIKNESSFRFMCSRSFQAIKDNIHFQFK